MTEQEEIQQLKAENQWLLYLINRAIRSYKDGHFSSAVNVLTKALKKVDKDRKQQGKTLMEVFAEEERKENL